MVGTDYEREARLLGGVNESAKGTPYDDSIAIEPHDDDIHSHDNHTEPSSCLDKYQPLTPGSVPSTAVNVAQVALGAGTLAMPFAMQNCGLLVLGTFLLVASAASCYTMHILVRLRDAVRVNTFEQLGEKLFGRWARYAIAFLVSFYCWGITVVYVFSIGDILHPLTDGKVFPEVFKGESGKRIVTVVFWAAFMLPLSLLRDINSLRYPSLFALFTLLVFVGALIQDAAATDRHHGAAAVQAVRVSVHGTEAGLVFIDDSESFAGSTTAPVPSTAAPATPVPTTAPATPVPTTAAPVTPVPSTAAPTTPVPTTAAPATPVPSTAAPTTPVPTTAAPATPVPSTAAPATPVPTTAAPVTPVPVAPAESSSSAASGSSATEPTPAPAGPSKTKGGFEWVHLSFHTFVALPTVFFGYCTQSNSFELYHEMRPRSVARMTIASIMAFVFISLCYAAAGIAGMVRFGSEVNGNILLNYKDTVMQSGMMIAAFVCFGFTITMSFPVCLLPVRDAVLQVLHYKSAYTTPTLVRMGVSAAIAVASLLVGLFFTEIIVAFSILGGVCGSSLVFIVPAITALKSGTWTRDQVGLVNVVAVWALLIGGSMAGIIGTFAGFYTTLHKK